MAQQQGDVLLLQTPDDGDIRSTNGVIEMTGSFETMLYLCLFGGNEDDPGTDDTTHTWWGNIDENLPERRYRSRTQFILRSLPATLANINRLRDAAQADLAVFTDLNIANSLEVTVSIPKLNRVRIQVNIEARGEEMSFAFAENWKAST